MQNTNSIKNKIDIIEYLLSMAIKGKLYDYLVENLINLFDLRNALSELIGIKENKDLEASSPLFSWTLDNLISNNKLFVFKFSIKFSNWLSSTSNVDIKSDWDFFWTTKPLVSLKLYE